MSLFTNNRDMRTALEKIALITQTVIGLIFVLFILFMPFGVLEVDIFDNSLVRILLGILSVAYLGISVYLVISTFTGNSALRKLLLFSDSESKTMTTAKVIKSLVVREGRKVEGVYVKKVKIVQDDKYGFNLRVTVNIHGSDAEESVDTLRCMIADSFYNGLGVRFNSIDFVIKRLSPKYLTDIEQSKRQAKLLKDKRICSKQYIHEPLEEVYTEEDIAASASEETEDKDEDKHNEDEGMKEETV